MKIEDLTTEVKINNVDGIGAVPMNQEIDYFGMAVMMKPSKFLQLAAPLSREPTDEFVDAVVNSPRGIGAPFLIIEYRGSNKLPKVVGHEGRNRMKAVLKAEGDTPIEVHLKFRGQISRARDLTSEIKRDLNRAMKQERTGAVVIGPLWQESIMEKAMNFTDRFTIEDIKKMQSFDQLNKAKRYAIKLIDKKGVNLEPSVRDNITQEIKKSASLYELQGLMRNFILKANR